MAEQAGYEIYVVGPDGDDLPELEADGIRRAARLALEAGGAEPPCAMTVSVTTAEQFRALNRDFAGLDEPTDVLSFGAEDEPYAVEPGEPPYLGDVIIARPIAEAQAQEAGHSLLTELQILTIHGSLHLLGYDHQDDAQQAEMRAREAAALEALQSTER